MPVTAPVFCSTMTDDLLVFVALFFCVTAAQMAGCILRAGFSLAVCLAQLSLLLFCFVFIQIHEPCFGRGFISCHNWPESLMLMYINLYSFFSQFQVSLKMH